MKRIKIKRVSSSTKCTAGVMIDESTGLPVCLTLELPDKQNKKFISCIPTGVYIGRPYNSEKFPNTYEITNVDGRSKILIHIGNTVNDIKGCVIVGLEIGRLDGKYAVLDSRKAMGKLRRILEDEHFEVIVE
jgi:hypothetical protein